MKNMIPQQKNCNNTFVFVLIVSVIAFSTCCRELESPCKNGDCLDVDLFCDGVVNCVDGSDEIADACIAQECQHYTFRCAYGACVAFDARCNGTKECADNSDEDREMCGYKKTSEPETKCDKGYFQCDSGECIIQDLACDGQPDCPDQSDESVENCASTDCPEYAFKCGNGACIEKTKKCNGKPDCFDRSDEAFELCGVELIDSIVTTPPTETLPFACTAPSINNSRLVYESDGKIISPGDKVPTGVSITYECARGYNLEGRGVNICNNGSWFSNIHPICTRYCQHKVLKGITFKAFCTRDGATVPCNDRIKPGTVAKISCPNKYRVAPHNPTQLLLCQEDGEWDYPPSRCEPICGEEFLPSVPFMHGGQATNITAVPWHVAVYKKKGNVYEHECGGTIISAKVVISAAHCFWDQVNNTKYENSLFTIAAGKYNRDYHRNDFGTPQFRNVSKIAIPPAYQDKAANFHADLAVIVLINALIFSDFVAPACIQWQKDGAKSAITGMYGQVAGWGKDESGGPSSVLRTIYVRGSSYEVCRNKMEPRYADSITDDKFCVMNEFNTNACEGDSGGGFAAQKEVNGKNIFYLWGVVSTGQPIGARCEHLEFVSYLNIQYYEVFITSFETSNRPK